MITVEGYKVSISGSLLLYLQIDFLIRYFYVKSIQQILK
jgi:hypothetical protein